MSQLLGRFLVTLILLSVVVVAFGGVANATPVVSTISEHDESPIRPIGDYSGEPDVGQTSPTSAGSVRGGNALVRVSGFDDVWRLSVWLWKARHGLTGF